MQNNKSQWRDIAFPCPRSKIWPSTYSVSYFHCLFEKTHYNHFLIKLNYKYWFLGTNIQNISDFIKCVTQNVQPLCLPIPNPHASQTSPSVLSFDFSQNYSGIKFAGSIVICTFAKRQISRVYGNCKAENREARASTIL